MIKKKEIGQDDDYEEIEENSDKEIDWSEDTIEEAEDVVEVTGNQPITETWIFIIIVLHTINNYLKTIKMTLRRS